MVGGRVEVDDTGHAVDVDAAGGDVGRDERRARPLRNSASARSRWAWDAVAVDRGRRDTGGRELAGDTVGAALGAAEHDGRADVR